MVGRESDRAKGYSSNLPIWPKDFCVNVRSDCYPTGTLAANIGPMREAWRRAFRGCSIVAALLCAFAGTARAQPPNYGVSPQDGAVPSRAEVEEMAAGGIDQMRLILFW